VALSIPRELMTLDEWDALPEDNAAHYELQEGVLIASPKWGRRHQVALLRLASEMERQLPPDYDLVPTFEVLVDAEWPATVRVPDLVAVHARGGEKRVTADEVLLAVEIIAPGSRTLDTRLKRFEYSEAGIPHYWLVDLDPPVPSVTVYGFGAPDDGYVESQTATGVLVVQEPFELEIDIEALVVRRDRPGRSEG
jgi:Uma2 family endonuclease